MESLKSSLVTMSVDLMYESRTNLRGKVFDTKNFEDLVASVKEKGVLVPVIIRLKKLG